MNDEKTDTKADSVSVEHWCRKLWLGGIMLAASKHFDRHNGLSHGEQVRYRFGTRSA
ncbi:hypothetical protein [Ensifer sp. B1-9]|uniref:hypothetical protein n=1 Tax=Ensifer sp. B1-9 TaxID=3141455 RepID=UPI003D1CF31B